MSRPENAKETRYLDDPLYGVPQKIFSFYYFRIDRLRHTFVFIFTNKYVPIISYGTFKYLVSTLELPFYSSFQRYQCVTVPKKLNDTDTKYF